GVCHVPPLRSRVRCFGLGARRCRPRRARYPPSLTMHFSTWGVSSLNVRARNAGRAPPGTKCEVRPRANFCGLADFSYLPGLNICAEHYTGENFCASVGGTRIAREICRPPEIRSHVAAHEAPWG